MKRERISRTMAKKMSRSGSPLEIYTGKTENYVNKNCEVIPFFKQYEIEKRNLLTQITKIQT